MKEEIVKEKAKLEELKKELADCEEAKYTSKITAIRGRVIRKLKNILKLYEKNEYRTDDEQKDYDRFEEELSENIFKHKIYLKERYSNEFIKGEAKVPDVITTFPKGVKLQVQKVINAINEIKIAKNAKSKVSAVANLGKEIGLLTATPVIFAGKFVIEHWYLLLLLWQGNKLGWFKGKKNGSENKEPDLQEQEQEAYETVRETEHATEVVLEPETSPSIETVTASDSLRNMERTTELNVQHAGEQQQAAIDHAAFAEQNETVTSSDSLRNMERTTELNAQHAGEQQQAAIDHAVLSGQNSVTSSISEENLFSVDEQKNLLYRLAMKSYETDASGNSYEVYRNFNEYLSTLGELSPEEVENVRNMVYNSPYGTSIRFIVDDNGLGFYNSEEEFINTITNGVGLVDIDTSTQSFQEYLSSLETVGNPLNLIGTEFDQSGLSPLEQMAFSKQVQEYMTVSGGVGVAAFILYQALKYGLAIPTHGVSLLAP